MESMEEKLHKMIIQSKIDETKDHMRRVAAKLDKDKIDKARMEKSGMYVPQVAALTDFATNPVSLFTSHANPILLQNIIAHCKALYSHSCHE